MEPGQKEETPNRPLLGEILLKRKLVTDQQLSEALEVQKKEKGFVGEILVKLGYVEEKDIVVVLIVQCGIPYIAINKYQIDAKLLSLLPEKLAREFYVMPFDRMGDVLNVVMTDPLNESIQKELEYATKCKIKAFIATRSEIEDAIAKWYKKEKIKK